MPCHVAEEVEFAAEEKRALPTEASSAEVAEITMGCGGGSLDGGWGGGWRRPLGLGLAAGSISSSSSARLSSCRSGARSSPTVAQRLLAAATSDGADNCAAVAAASSTDGGMKRGEEENDVPTAKSALVPERAQYQPQQFQFDNDEEPLEGHGGIGEYQEPFGGPNQLVFGATEEFRRAEKLQKKLQKQRVEQSGSGAGTDTRVGAGLLRSAHTVVRREYFS